MTRFDGRASVARGLGLAVLVAAGALLSAASLRAEPALEQPDPAAERTDVAIGKDVVDAILRYPWYTVFDSIEAGVEDGVVTLRGSVNQPYRKSDVEKRVARIAGVKGVSNAIRVQPLSPFDDRLRRELVHRIYGDERFVQYASWAHPPIRIIVDRGRVTLTGFIGSAVEQQLVGHIARGTLAFAVDNQVRLESEKNAEPVRKALNPAGTP
jgi:osmotically-inducible protein OsmY